MGLWYKLFGKKEKERYEVRMERVRRSLERLKSSDKIEPVVFDIFGVKYEVKYDRERSNKAFAEAFRRFYKENKYKLKEEKKKFDEEFNRLLKESNV